MSRKRKPARLTPEQLTEWELAPEYRAANLLAKLHQGSGIKDLAFELLKQTQATNGGDMARPCEILTSQAHSLDSLFNRMAALALSPGNGANAERLLKLAFRAQAQCARTLEVLANIKNPPIVYARQANVTTGPQQINNSIPPPAQVREIEGETTAQIWAVPAPAQLNDSPTLGSGPAFAQHVREPAGNL